MTRLLLVFFLLFQSVLGDIFYNPPPPGSSESAVYELEQQVNIRWQSDKNNTRLGLCQRNLTSQSTTCEYIRDAVTKTGVPTKDFQITEKGAKTTPTASSTSFTNSPPTTLSTSSSSGGLSPQTKVGVGVGVGLGGAFLIALGAIIWYFRRRARIASAASGSPDKQESITQLPQQSTPAELPGNRVVDAELPGDRGVDAELPGDRGVDAELPGDRGVEVSGEPAPVRYELP